MFVWTEIEFLPLSLELLLPNCYQNKWFVCISQSFSRVLAQHCHNIERLDVSGCKKISDQAIHAISKHCAKLISINLESCINITDKSLKDLSDGCSVSRFVACAEESDQAIMSQNSNLNVFFVHRICRQSMCLGVI